MPSLLSNLECYFSSSYAGRYLAIILLELHHSNPNAFRTLFSKLSRCRIPRDGVIVAEYGFMSQSNRRADLAILRDAKPILLVEIKEADGKKPNEAQLQDYVKFVKKNYGTRFLFMSRYIANSYDDQILKNAPVPFVRTCRFADLYRHLRNDDATSSLIRRYLEDLGVVYDNAVIDMPSLQYLTNAILGTDKGSPKATTIDSMPSLLQVIFRNLSSLGEWVQEANVGRFSQQFKRRLATDPYYNRKNLAKRISKLEGDDALDELDIGDFGTGGGVYFYGSAYLVGKPGRKVHLEVGYWTEIDNSERPSFRLGMYAKFNWKPWDSGETYIYLDEFPNWTKAQLTLRECLKTNKRDALKACPERVRKTIEAFVVP